MIRAFLTVLFAVCVAAGSFPGEADKITSLPGMPSGAPVFNMYSGYLPINSTTGKFFFYYFVEATNGSSTAPLVRWLNGGPGCSSLGGGGFEENGPFIPDENGNLQWNPTSWNQLANMLYIESPVGVGFSYSKTLSDYSMSDNSTAQDNYVALLAFLDKFPHYKGRDFFLAGESYAGHYVPEMVSVIVSKGIPLNFRGFAVGNPTTHMPDDFLYGTYRTWAARGLVSWPVWESILQACPPNTTFLSPPSQCQNALNAGQSQVGNLLNPYDLDVPMCASEEQIRMGLLMHRAAFAQFEKKRKTTTKTSRSSLKWKKMLKTLPPSLLQHGADEELLLDNPFLPYDPCEDGAVQTYLNRADVRQALHATSDVNGVSQWTDCTSDPRFNYDYNGFYQSQLPLYQSWISSGNFRILVYSGTADTVVPYLGTQKWVWDLQQQQTPTEPWASWQTPQHPHQTAGYSVRWGQFRFTTIRNAGHLVPQTSPLQAYCLLRSLLYGGTC